MNRIIPASEIQKNNVKGNGKASHRNHQMEKTNWQSLQIDRLNASVNRLQSEFRNLSFQYSAVEKAFCEKNKGCKIEITFLSKKSLRGRLVDSDKYCFIVEDGRVGKSLLILKSSVAFIRPLG